MSDDIIERLSGQSYSVNFGQSFFHSPASKFHSMRYDFKPASMATDEGGILEIDANNEVTVTIPQERGDHAVFRGGKRLHQKECILIIDNSTGEITLEKLDSNFHVKKTRAPKSVRSRTAPSPPPAIARKVSKISSKPSPSIQQKPPTPPPPARPVQQPPTRVEVKPPVQHDMRSLSESSSDSDSDSDSSSSGSSSTSTSSSDSESEDDVAKQCETQLKQDLKLSDDEDESSDSDSD